MKLSKKIMGSLALRVLLVCMALLVVPLLINTLLVFRQDYILKMRELYIELNMIGSGRELLLNELFKYSESNLELITSALAGKSPEEQQKLIDKIKIEQGLATLLYLNCTNWDQPYLGYDPETGLKQIYFQRTFEGKELIMGINAQKFIENLSYLQGALYPFHVALMDEKGTLFVQDYPSLKLENLHLFTQREISDPHFFSYLNSMKKKKEHFGLKIPIYNSTFSLVVAVPIEAVIEVETNEIFSRMASLLFLIIILGGAGAIWLTRRMARPLNQLVEVMEKVGNGDLRARYKNDPMGFEINVLGNDFNRMIDSVTSHMEEAKNERVARVLLENEMKIGHDIQSGILPREMPQIKNLDIAAGWKPAQEVAGDFYDLYYKKEQNQLFFTIADAAGKGISACLYSLLVRSMLRSYAASHENFTDIIRLTNQLFCLDTEDSGAFVTAWVANLDLTTNQLQYCSCGHPPAILRRSDGRIEELTTQNTALGVISYDHVNIATVQLQKGDLLLLYTDGLIEAHNSQMELFGKRALMEIIKTAQNSSAHDLVNTIINKVALFEKKEPQFDDLTLLAIQIL